ncbi:helix-turn-helix domain-containing protein [Kitasatospora sp. NPDC001540]|uniref:helix-turn-helix domain-containing protein n=1 Tax=Kitasatospora sp. NPDC001540 TaxID=3364014 RepID=UPI0036CA20E2
MIESDQLGEMLYKLWRAFKRDDSLAGLAARTLVPAPTLNNIFRGAVIPSLTVLERICADLAVNGSTFRTLAEMWTEEHRRMVETSVQHYSPPEATTRHSAAKIPRPLPGKNVPSPLPARQSGRHPIVQPKAPAPDPLLYSTAGEFVAGLNEVLVWAGEPSLRLLVERSAHRPTGRVLARSTISAMLKSGDLPKLDLVESYLKCCGVREDDIETWRVIWRRIRLAQRQTGAI